MPTGRDADELRELIRDHEVKGYPVTVPIFGTGKVTTQWRIGGGRINYVVCGDNPIPFEEYAKAVHADSKPLTLKQWEEGDRLPSIAMLQPELQDTLEGGGKVSMKDHIYTSMMAKGWMDMDQRVTCDSFEARHVKIDPKRLKKGMIIEFSEAGGGPEWAGRFVGFEDIDDARVALVEMFAPTPFMRAPEAVVPRAIRPGFHSRKSGVFGYGTAQAWEDRRGKLPKGKWADDEREYILDDWIDLSEIEDLCREYYSNEPHCVWQAMMLYIIPLNIAKGTFHPMPEGGDPDEFVVEFEEE